MKKLLIVTNNQFGYLTDTLKYCEYLSKLYEIEVLCCNNNMPKIVNENIKVYYLNNSNKFSKRIEFAKSLKKIAINLEPDIIFIDYFIGCSIIKILLGNRYVYNMDIRTGAISNNRIIRKLKDLILRFESSRFSNISIISSGLQKKIHINKAHYLPLGADINMKNKDIISEMEPNKNISIVYVGTLFERNIGQTILGIKNFLDKYNMDEYNIKYDIIGFSPNPNEEEIINKYIDEFKLTDVIKFHGRMDYKIALDFIAKADIGISYIPITEYFNFQPPTKTFEYLLSGIPCLATETYANAQIINKTNGVLIKDTAESFSEGLYEIIKNYKCYNADEIINSVKDYTWDNIIATNLEPYLISLCDK